MRAANPRHDFELIRGAYLLSGRSRLLDIAGQGDITYFQTAIDPNIAEQEPRQVLITLFGIDDSVISRMAAIDEGAWRKFCRAGVSVTIEYGRIVGADEPITKRTDEPRRPTGGDGVILGVAADETKKRSISNLPFSVFTYSVPAGSPR